MKMQSISALLILLIILPSLPGLKEANAHFYEIPLECEGYYVREQTWTADFDLGTTLTEISNVYIDWSGSIRAEFAEDIVTGERFPMDAQFVADIYDFVTHDFCGSASLRTGAATYPNPEPFDLRSTFSNEGWSTLLNGQGTIEIGFWGIIRPMTIITIEDPNGELNSATLVIEAIPPVPRTITVGPGAGYDFNTIQAAIDDSNDGDTVIVADGIYTGQGNRDIDFSHGLPEDQTRAITVRSINGPENCIIDCNGTWTEYHRGFDFHCGEDANSIVDGFTITNGYAYDGGGIKCCYSSSPIISNCVIMRNSFNNNGGGIYCRDSSPMLTNCTFNDNWCQTAYIDPPEDLRGCGGGMCNYENSSPILSNCTFSKNITQIGGGGIVNYLGSNPTLTNCIFNNNWAEFGGGMCNVESSPTLTNCTFSNNDADWGSGMLNILTSCPTVTNCILWDGGDEIQNYGSTIMITYSGVQGGSTGVYLDPNSTLNWGEGNIDADPCFADADNGDFHLKSQAGRWDANSESWVQDDVTSPCIDAGNPGCPVGDEPAPNGNRRNMGAYGGTLKASKSPDNWRSIADLTNDWILDSNDLKVFVDYWLNTGECIPSDLDRNQLVDFNDFALFSGSWPEFTILDCLLTTTPEYPLWVTLGKPECWCYPRQCHGDVDGSCFLGKCVTMSDLDAFKTGTYGPFSCTDDNFYYSNFNCPCLDFNHDGRVDYIDESIIRYWFNRTDVPADCEGILYPLSQLYQISENWLEDNNP